MPLTGSCGAWKNRFGSTNEIGVFEMSDTGLREVKNPSEYMLSGKPPGASGSVVTCTMEGTRPMLLEVQALVCRTNFGLPRRTAVGVDVNRVNLLMAVLEKRLNLQLSGYDAYVNVAGGIRLNEPAIDLALVMAIISSYKDISDPGKDCGFWRSGSERRDPGGQYGAAESTGGKKNWDSSESCFRRAPWSRCVRSQGSNWRGRPLCATPCNCSAGGKAAKNSLTLKGKYDILSEC